MRTAAVLTAAGSGSRLGHPVPKALAALAGTSLVAHAARRLVASGVVDLLVVTVPDGHLEEVRAALDDALADGPAVPVHCTAGGPSRQASVAVALAVLPTDVDVVLVHDAARALAPASLVTDVVAAVRAGNGAVIPVMPVTDTIVQVAPAGIAGAAHVRASATEPVVLTPDRTALRAVQTPPGFDRALLDRAHAAAAERARDEARAATDDSSLVALLGEPVVTVRGHELALKITTPRDLVVAGLLLGDGGADDVPALQPAGGAT